MRIRFQAGNLAWIRWVVFALAAASAWGQSNFYERPFPQSKGAVEKALRAIQGNMAGRLPVLDGFATGGERSLDRYQRGYYQANAEIMTNPSGGSIVRIRAKVTAWYSDPAGSHSGYQLLSSNGRLESDLLDQLSEQLAGAASEKTVASAPAPKLAPDTGRADQPSAPEPIRRFPDSRPSLSSSLRRDLPSPEATNGHAAGQAVQRDGALQAEANSLEEILKNTARPHNLIAVKQSGTPVVLTPSLTAKPQFLASMHDEFELLDFNADWVHVRISGLSRGWIWRNSVEMPDGIPDSAVSPALALAPAANLFHVVREEIAPFPGDWEPLRGKNVKILSVQKMDESENNSGSKERLEYAKSLLEKSYGEIAEKNSELAGVVVIFDAADGGMIGAPLPVLQQWKAGALTDSALWHKCFFDPPEVFEPTDTPAGQ
jgi:hypothetical protein